MQQVTTVEQARQVAELGVDIIIAQGTEGGGFTGTIAGIVLVPQIVDAVDPIPVVAAGGIVDGRSFAAMLVAGAVGANIGTRFLASDEASISDAWKRSIVDARADDAVKVDVWDAIFAKPGNGAFDVVPRSLRTPFIEEWSARPEDAGREAERLMGEIGSAIAENRMEEFVPFTGQGAGRIEDIRPAAQILHELVVGAASVLREASILAR
jgi:nitronate monooxygenase/enoyl-[acyl-carrier protein] reductase II